MARKWRDSWVVQLKKDWRKKAGHKDNFEALFRADLRRRRAQFRHLYTCRTTAEFDELALIVARELLQLRLDNFFRKVAFYLVPPFNTW
jgi:hypothetical protein